MLRNWQVLKLEQIIIFTRMTQIPDTLQMRKKQSGIRLDNVPVLTQIMDIVIYPEV